MTINTFAMINDMINEELDNTVCAGTEPVVITEKKHRVIAQYEAQARAYVEKTVAALYNTWFN